MSSHRLIRTAILLACAACGDDDAKLASAGHSADADTDTRTHANADRDAAKR